MKKFLKSPWTIGITTTLLGFLLTIGYDLLKGKQVFTTIALFFSTLWGWIVAFLTFELKVWWVILGFAVLIIVLFVVLRLNKLKDETKPDFINYTSDHFRLWKWSWTWEWSNQHKKWHVANLQAHCPKCDTPMIAYGFGQDVFQCPRCAYRSEAYNHEQSHEVERVIFDNLERQRKNGEMQT